MTHDDADAAPHLIETRGIDLIPDAERRGRPRNLLGMWLGTNLNVFYVVNGAVVVSLGLSFLQSLVAIVLGNLAFIAVGLASVQGPTTGTSTFTVSRAAFGPNGGRGLSMLNWVTCIGFEASGLALVALAALAVLSHIGVDTSTALKIAVVVIAALVQGALPLIGHAGIVAVQRKLAWISGVVFVVMAIVVIPRVHLSAIAESGNLASLTVAVALIISAGGLSWANTGSDYSRYLPRNSSPRQVFWYSTLGGYLPAVLLEILGAAMASIATTATDPISGIPDALPGWVAIPYLLFAIITLLAVNSMDLYSSGLTLQSMGLPLTRWKCVLLDLVICTGLCFLVVFNDSFSTYYAQFLGLLVIWLAPWFAIYAVDWLLRRGAYDAPALVDPTSTGRYWRHGGFFLPGIIAQVAGMTAAALWINSSAFIGPLSHATGESDLSVFAGLAVAAAVYWALARKTVAADNAALITPNMPVTEPNSESASA